MHDEVVVGKGAKRQLRDLRQFGAFRHFEQHSRALLLARHKVQRAIRNDKVALLSLEATIERLDGVGKNLQMRSTHVMSNSTIHEI